MSDSPTTPRNNKRKQYDNLDAVDLMNTKDDKNEIDEILNSEYENPNYILHPNQSQNKEYFEHKAKKKKIRRRPNKTTIR